MINANEISKHLCTPIKITVFDTLESTNKTASMIGDADGEDQIIIARSQTGGRGRMGRSFFSPDGGLYMSFLLHPDIPPRDAWKLTAASGVAVLRAISRITGKAGQIKWVNDVYLDSKKVCGILAQSQIDKNGAIKYAVIGIGINLTVPSGGFPDEIKHRAGAVFDFCDGVAENRLAAAVIDELTSLYKGGFSPTDFLDEYKSASFVPGKRVSVMRTADGESREALALFVDDECKLHVRYADGSTEALSSGDVSLKI